MALKTFHPAEPFELELGGVLPNLSIGYHTFGTLNADRSNVVWVCHALTANADPTEWWSGIVGQRQLIDPDRHFVVCANILGSCYGTTGPLSTNPDTGRPYYSDFPGITMRDIVRVHRLLADHLGVGRIQLGAGGSLGGSQLLEWAAQEPTRFNELLLIATNAAESPWAIAIHQAQRMAIEASGDWGWEVPGAGKKGLRAARAMGMVSYRSYRCFDTKQPNGADRLAEFPAAAYQQYQGEKLAHRFNAYSYHVLLNAADTHNIGRGRGGVEKVLGGIQAHTLMVGISSDLLYPPAEQRSIAERVPFGRYREIDSDYGHDGFLVETRPIAAFAVAILQTFQTVSNGV